MGKKMAFTGHRPNKLYGYDLESEGNVKLSNMVREQLLEEIENGFDHFITGMAMGADMLMAIEVLVLRQEGYNIKLECAIPCENHTKKWTVGYQDLWSKIVEDADIVTYVSDKPYTAWCMQKRNEYMVDNADKMLGIYDGTKGGTGNCVDYANKKYIGGIYIDPKTFEMTEISFE